MKEWSEGAFRALVERWLYSLEEEVRSRPGFAGDEQVLATAVGDLLEGRLTEVSAINGRGVASLADGPPARRRRGQAARRRYRRRRPRRE